PCVELGATLRKVLITDVEDNIFFGLLYVKTDRGELQIDCRPSDGVALALKYRCPIHATTAALEKAQHLDLTAGHQESERVRSWLASLGEPQVGKYE
ncbi:MAG: bifunctional nuclease family protein, partial [Acidobacteriota bacterium]|nr:bifunctional nuclease family protein [Acidobacteriota bacterium]